MCISSIIYFIYYYFYYNTFFFFASNLLISSVTKVKKETKVFQRKNTFIANWGGPILTYYH